MKREFFVDMYIPTIHKWKHVLKTIYKDKADECFEKLSFDHPSDEILVEDSSGRLLTSQTKFGILEKSKRIYED